MALCRAPETFSCCRSQGIERKLRGKHLKKRHKCDVFCAYFEFRNETGRQQKVTGPFTFIASSWLLKQLRIS
jgi:hypothetical protein